MWMFKGKEFSSDDIKKAFGFVYIITDKTTGRSYIGQKHFWSSKTTQKNKVKKKVKCESDWKKYQSSNEYLKTLDENQLDKYILFLCVSKGQLNYIETLIQMDLRVLENQDLWYNGIVNMRCHHTHIKLDKLIDKDESMISELYTKYKN